VSTRCLVGTIDPDEPTQARVRYVHSDGYPAYILPTLEQIWSTTCGHDTTALIDAVLAHQWSYLGADVTAATPITFTGEQAVPGVGMASEFDPDSEVTLLPIAEGFDHVHWVYLIDPAQATIAAYAPGRLMSPVAVQYLTGAVEPAVAAVQLPAELREAAHAAGTAAGERIADAWAQTHLADPAEKAKLTASRILAGDPDTQQTVPRPELTAGPRNTVPAALAGLVGESAWSPLTPQDRAALLDGWRDAARAALARRVVERCRALVNSTGAGRDLSHLHPDRLRIGGVGVFALDPAWTTAADGQLRIPVGFAGTLVDTWNGFAVFVCSRTVAEAIVTDQQVHRDRLYAELVEQGHSPADADRGVDAALARMSIDGDTIVVDETAVTGDADAVTRIEPDRDGLYQVMGGSWTWEPVAPYDCDRIVGELPPPHAQQQFVLLPHTWLRVPHDRIQVINVRTVPDTPGRQIAVLALDGMPVAEAAVTADGPHLSWLGGRLHRDDWAAYLTACRHHGRPASEAHVLDALVTEYQVALAVRQADADGGALARLLDADGSILRLRPVWPAPRGHAARMHLGELLREQEPHPQGHLWQLWTGAAWRHLTSISGFHQVTAPPQEPNPEQILAYLIGHARYERLDRDRLIEHAAERGIPLDPQWRDELIRDVLRAAHKERGRRAGLPVDDLPILSAGEGLELGRIATGGSADPPTDRDQPPTGDPQRPPTD
jgi:hypothetical protein